MANLNQQMIYPQNIGDMQRGIQQPIQYPYTNNNLLVNSPYENYMGRMNQTQPNQFLKCRPVSSKEQAQALQIDLDGSLWVFTDIGNEKIYTKQINNDGTATFKTYSFIKDQIPTTSVDNYVTKEEFNQVIQKLVAAMQVTNSQELVPTPAQNKTQENKAVSTLLNFN